MEDGAKQQLFIREDGKTYKKLMLFLNDKRKREEVIAKHFRSFYEDTYNIILPSKLIERDNRHDFTFTNENGEKLFLEIVAVSDTSAGFQKQSNQIKFEKLLANINNSAIAIVPPRTSNKELAKAIKNINKYPVINNIKNHIYELYQERIEIQRPVIRLLADMDKQRIYITDGVNEPLGKIIQDAISEKEKEDYDHVSEMVLLIDNQIIEHGMEAIGRAWINLVKRNQKSPFKEIFLYDGYYSENNGRAAFSIYPLKCAFDKKVKLALSPLSRWIIPIMAFFSNFKRIC